MGSGAKVVAISNRLDGGLFKSLDTLEPSTKLNGSVLQGLNFSGASGMAGDTAVVMDANSNTFAFIYQLPGWGASGYATGQSGYRNPRKAHLMASAFVQRQQVHSRFF